MEEFGGAADSDLVFSFRGRDCRHFNEELQDKRARPAYPRRTAVRRLWGFRQYLESVSYAESVRGGFERLTRTIAINT